MREKLKFEGKLVTLEEIEPKFFSYVVKWRNDPELNRYIDQSFILTEELEKKWYEETYLSDDTQGFFIGIDKKSGKPFGTIGWEFLDEKNHRCVYGRLICSDPTFSMHLIDMQFTLSNFLYERVDNIFTHVVKENLHSLRFNKSMGFEKNLNDILYPGELYANGMELIEFYRTKEMYFDIRKKFHENFPNIF